MSSPLGRRKEKELAVSRRGCGEHMVVKSLLISGNLPEYGITFCYKPQPCQKPGFPRMNSLCAAEHQRACSAGCQRVKQQTRAGKAAKPRGGGEGGAGGTDELASRGAGLPAPVGTFMGLVGSAFRGSGQQVLSLGLGGLICAVFIQRCSALPNPMTPKGMAAPTPSCRWRLGWCTQPEGL